MITTPLTRTVAALAVALSAITLTACDVRELGSYRAPEILPAPATVPPATQAPAAKPVKNPVKKPAAKPVQHPPVIVLRAKLNSKYGTLVVDRHGRTLYRGDADRAKPSKSRCHGKCLVLWRPALVSSTLVKGSGVNGTGVAVAGLDPALVDTIRRGRSRQLTVGGWPVYTFAHDVHRGDVKGQCGRGFFAVTPEGRRASMT